mgnify:CR=1 FL=1
MTSRPQRQAECVLGTDLYKAKNRMRKRDRKLRTPPSLERRECQVITVSIQSRFRSSRLTRFQKIRWLKLSNSGTSSLEHSLKEALVGASKIEDILR